MLLCILSFSCSHDFPADAVVRNECYYCPDPLPSRIVSENGTIKCASLETELFLQGAFTLIDAQNDVVVFASAKNGSMHVKQTAEFVEISNADVFFLYGSFLLLKSVNKLVTVRADVLHIMEGATDVENAGCNQVFLGIQTIVTMLFAEVQNFSVSINALFKGSTLHAQTIDLRGKLAVAYITALLINVNILGALEFTQLDAGTYLQQSHSESRGGTLRCNEMQMKNNAMASSKILTVDYLQVKTKAMLGNNCEITAASASLANEFYCRGVLNAGRLHLSSMVFNSMNCVLQMQNLSVWNSSVTFVEALTLNYANISLSTVAFQKLVVSTFCSDGSLITGEELLSHVYFVLYHGALSVAGQLTLVSAQIAAGVEAGSLVLLSSRTFTTVHINSIVLGYVTSDLQQYTELIKGINNAQFESPEYTRLADELSSYNGTMYVASTVVLDAPSVDVQCLICDGEIQLSTYQTITTKYLAIFNTKVQSQLVFFTFFGFKNNGYLRSKIPMQLRALQVIGMNLTINQNVASMLSFTVSSQILMQQSTITGIFSYFSTMGELLDIQFVAGNFSVTDAGIYLSDRSQLVLNHVNFSTKGTIDLLGNVLILSQFMLKKKVVLNASLIRIYNLMAYGPAGYRRQSACCGGSAQDLGGCSMGTPLPPGSINAGDVCGSNTLGAQAGADLQLLATDVELKYLILRGKDSTYNNNSQCSGAGSGGKISVRALNLYLSNESLIILDGGDCQDFCQTGGAGSSGIAEIGFLNLFVDQQKATQVLDQFLSYRNGKCKFAAKSPQDMCNFLTRLDLKTMSCQLDYVLLTLVVLCLTAVSCLTVWLTIHCCSSKYYDTQEEQRELLSDAKLFELIWRDKRFLY